MFLSALVALWFFWSNLILSLKPRLERELSALFSQNVKVDYIKAEVWPTIAINLKGVHIAPDMLLEGVHLPPDWSCDEVISAKNFILQLKLLPLLSKRFEVLNLVAQSPSLNFIKSSNGMNWGSFPTKDCKKQKSDGPYKQPTQIDRSDSTKETPLIEIHMISVKDGKIEIDELGKPVNIVDDINFNSSFDIKSGQATLSDPRLSLKRKQQQFGLAAQSISADLKSASLSIKGAKFSFKPWLKG